MDANNENELEKAFQEAIHRADNTELRFPPDIMLHFYAYYKRATNDNTNYLLNGVDGEKLIGAFKMNAIFQVKNLTKEEAKQKYIDLVNKYIPPK